MNDIDNQVRVLADILTGSHHSHLPQPDTINIRDGVIRLGFDRAVTDLRKWAEWCGADTYTLQSNDRPNVVVEIFDTTAQGVVFKGLAMYPRPVLVGA